MARAEVAALSQLGLESAAEVLAGALEQGDDGVRAVRGYLAAAGAPGPVLQELLHALLARSDLEPQTRLSALLAVLREDVASLSVGIFAEPFHAPIVEAIRALGSGLHTLDMKGVWLRGEDLSAFCRALPCLPGLRALGVPRMASDGLLEAVGRHCAKLRALDVSGEAALSRDGLQALCRPGLSATLQILDIGNLAEMNVDPEDIAFLIRSLPRLASLGTYSHVGKALVLLEDFKGSTKLEYLHDVGTTPRALDAMERLCPGLTSVYLDSPARGVVPLLRRLPRLRELKLHQFDAEELLQLLQEAGVGLESVELLAARGSGPLDLARVSALCPRLARLECYLVRCTGCSGAMSWPALRSFGAFHCSVPGPVLLGLALRAPLLARLSVGAAPELSDADVSELCAALPELRELWLAGAPRLTQAAALCLLTGCPQLRSLGELSGWGLHQDHVDELRLFCLQANLDVALWYYPAHD